MAWNFTPFEKPSGGHICSKCGTRNDIDAERCTKCGNRVGKESTEEYFVKSRLSALLIFSVLGVLLLVADYLFL